MSDRANRHLHPGLVLLVAAAMLAAATLAAAQESRPDAPGGSHEGIKVHGHWTIEVRNPDGTPSTHREFENSLAFDGPLNLATAMGRSATVGLWILSINYANSFAGPCLDSNSAPTACYLVESADPHGGGYVSHTLTVNAPFRPDPNAGTLTVSGTFTVQNNVGPIGSVGSFLGGCAPSVTPASCTLTQGNSYNNLGFSAFSVANLANPVPVLVGQLVQVTVVFSFS